MRTRRRPATRQIPPTCRPSTGLTGIRAEGGRAVLIKRTERQARRSSLAATVGSQSGIGLDRRTFLRRSGVVAGGLATIGALPLASVQKAEAAGTNVSGATIRKIGRASW